MAGKTITLRIRSSEGTKRLEISPYSSGAQIYSKIKSMIGISDISVYTDPTRKTPPMKFTHSSSLKTWNLKHGDMLYVFPTSKESSFVSSDSSSPTPSVASTSKASSSSSSSIIPAKNFIGSSAAEKKKKNQERETPVKEDEVDGLLRKMDGMIPRPRTKNCNHNFNSKCIHCTPCEPYDPAYLKEKEIKHLSFHSYLRKLSSGIDKGKFVALDDISCSIKEGCKEHPPWPKGVCSKCQPPAITLNRQIYRHVDNIMFENPNIVDNFLTFWRNTGNQRIGFLYGRHEVFTEVPLGIKTVVVAIYEPPQESSKDFVKLVKDDREEQVDEIAKKLGLEKVGWIFTDLIPTGDGEVKHIRNSETHFLSAQECIMAGYFQLKHPNPCKSASSKTFGSKFVTVIVTGNKEKQIHMEGYQVSNQCMALVRDRCLIPTKDAPELGWVRESSNTQYVPDVFYKETDKYGNDITKISRPLPVMYLLVDVPVSTPKEPVYTFPVKPGISSFPIENRPMEGHLQDFGAFATYRKQFRDSEIGDFFRNFHVLIFMANLDVYHLYEHMDPLLEAVKTGNNDVIMVWAKSEHWQTVEMLIDAHNSGFQ